MKITCSYTIVLLLLTATIANAKYGGGRITPDHPESFKYVYDIRSTNTGDMVTFKITMSQKEAIKADWPPPSQVDGQLALRNAGSLIFHGFLQKSIQGKSVTFSFSISPAALKDAELAVGYGFNRSGPIVGGYLDIIALKDFEPAGF